MIRFVKPTNPKPSGRPSEYSDEIAGSILARISNGESLRQICRSEGFPDHTTVYRWMIQRENFGTAYARARLEQADTLADEIQAIADDESIPSDSRRIRVDARKWIAAKLKPKTYGERVVNEHTGVDGGPIQHQAIERRIVDSKGEK